jgi:hypothetical protein
MIMRRRSKESER